MIRTKRQNEFWQNVKRTIRLYPLAMASAITKYLQQSLRRKHIGANPMRSQFEMLVTIEILHVLIKGERGKNLT